MGLGLIGSAILGGIGGAGDAMQANSLQEMKDAALAKREETLARLQRETHAANATFDANLKEQARAKEEAAVGGIFKSAPVPSKTPDSIYGGPNQNTDPAQGAEDDAGTIVVKGKEPSAIDKARAVLDYAMKSGNKGAIDAAQKSYENAIKEHDSATKEKRETHTAEHAARRDDQMGEYYSSIAERNREDAAAMRRGEKFGKRGDNGLAERKFDAKTWELARKEIVDQLVMPPDPLNPNAKEQPDHMARMAVIRAMRGFEEDNNESIPPSVAQGIVGKVVQANITAARKAFPKDPAKAQEVFEKGFFSDLNVEVKKYLPQMADLPSDKPGYTLPDKGAPKAADPAKKDSPGIVANAQSAPAAPKATTAPSMTGAYAEERQRKQQEINDTAAAAQTKNLTTQQREALADRLRQLQSEMDELNRKARG